jgi:Pro-kumamolisin, activation domain/Bacterial Ig-like domain (group 3)
VSLPGHTLQLLPQSSPSAAGAAAAGQPIDLTVVLRRTNEAGFQAYLLAVQTPGSPSYHHFLSQTALAAQFGPSQQAYDAINSYLQSQGLAVTQTSANLLTLDATGTRAQVQQAFHVQIADYQSPSGQAFYANQADPSVPAAIAPYIQSVLGLDNLAVGAPGSLPAQPTAAPFAAPNPNPMAIGVAYNFPLVTTQSGQSSNGAGQIIGLMEFDDFYDSDLARWLALTGLPASLANQVTRVPVKGGTTPSNTSGTAEIQLDVEAVVGLAQGATFRAYETKDVAFDTRVPAMLNKMINEGVTVVTNSWSSCEDDSTPAALMAIDSVLAQASAGGVPVFNDTGDNGNDCQYDLPFVYNHAAFPADSPNGIGVGGTNLQVTAGGAYLSEHWWDWGSDTAGAGGYGTSTVFARPSYQNTFVPGAFRSVPDIVSDGDPDTGIKICVEVLGGPYRCTGGHTGAVYGGTSLATPISAAGLALIQQAQGAQGNFNPVLYAAYNSGATIGFHTTASMLPSMRGATNDFAHLGLGSFDLGALASVLPGNTPAFTCASPSTPIGSSVVCTTTLTGILPVGSMVVAQTTSPAGASLSGCTATGGLVCGALGPAATNSACGGACPATSPACSGGQACGVAGSGSQTLTCPAACVGGSTFSLTFSSSSPGPITETLTINPGPGALVYSLNASGAAFIAIGSSLTLQSSANPAALGTPLTFSATVACTGFSPTGSVTFTIDGTTGAPVMLGSGGIATFSTSSLSVGTHTVTAAYSGNANCAVSTSGTLTQVVGQAGASTTLSSSGNPSESGQSITFTATVACAVFTPTGLVTFTIDGTAGTPVTLGSGGTATFATSSLTSGSHTVTAAYSGDSNCGPSTSSSLTQTVNAPSPAQPVGYGYCYPAVNAPPPGAPCTPFTGSGAYQSLAQSAIQYCQTLSSISQQQACIAQSLGNIGGFICTIGCGAVPGNGAPAGAGVPPARLPGAYCTNPDGSRFWVPQGAPAPPDCS